MNTLEIVITVLVFVLGLGIGAFGLFIVTRFRPYTWTVTWIEESTETGTPYGDGYSMQTETGTARSRSEAVSAITEHRGQITHSGLWPS